jgi:hypothetical protein
MQYRKRPVIIEAFQMTRERRLDNIEWPEWLNRAWNKEIATVGSLYCTESRPSTPDNIEPLRITTLEGNQLVSWDDYIIRGVQGEIYPCKPDIFQATYEIVE